MAFGFAWSPLPLRWMDPTLWFVFFARIGFAWFVFFAAHFLWTKQLLRSFVLSTRVWLVFYLALIIHFNLKINVGVWRSTLYDASLYQIDQWLSPLIHALLWWHPYLDQLIDVTPAYAVVFEFSFLAAFLYLSIVNPGRFRLVFCATILTLLFGSILYVLLPAIGPFMYELPNSPYMRQVVVSMYQRYYSYVSTGGVHYPDSFLIQGLAAMPSLHLANSAVFTYFLMKQNRWVGSVALTLTVFIFIEALYTKFHYSLDLIFGLLVAALAIVLTYLLYARRSTTT